MMGGDLPHRMERRVALKWMLTAAAALPLARQRVLANPGRQPAGHGYGSDPDLQKNHTPGDLWPLTFSDAQRRTAAALSDMIIPADEESPAASQVGVVDFLDEWVSAPYPGQQQDRVLILEGFTWIDGEAKLRFGKSFVDLNLAQRSAICDDICYEPAAGDKFKSAAKFFARYRDLTAGGFYTTPEGMADLKYVGNTPLATFDGPPLEVLRRVGLRTD